MVTFCVSLFCVFFSLSLFLPQSASNVICVVGQMYPAFWVFARFTQDGWTEWTVIIVSFKLNLFLICFFFFLWFFLQLLKRNQGSNFTINIFFPYTFDVWFSHLLVLVLFLPRISPQRKCSWLFLDTLFIIMVHKFVDSVWHCAPWIPWSFLSGFLIG